MYFLLSLLKLNIFYFEILYFIYFISIFSNILLDNNIPIKLIRQLYKIIARYIETVPNNPLYLKEISTDIIIPGNTAIINKINFNVASTALLILPPKIFLKPNPHIQILLQNLHRLM